MQRGELKRRNPGHRGSGRGSDEATKTPRELMMRLNLSEVNSSTLPQAAAWYANLGLRIFPCIPHTKQPYVRWSEVATNDPVKVADWWTAWPNANIGLALGNGLHALDIDTKSGQDGYQSYLEAGGLPDYMVEQPIQITPNGGLHLLFATSDGEPLRNFTRRGSCGGLDMRTDRGYILLAPSVLPQGTPYRWGDGDPTLPLPTALSDAIRGWSKHTPSNLGDPFDLPAPTSFTPDLVNRWIDALGPEHATFLRSGECLSGDRSKQAWITSHHAFLRGGWSLADMAAIGPHTVLATIGEDPPHHASDPWAWICKYTIRSAWETASKELDAKRVENLFDDETEGRPVWMDWEDEKIEPSGEEGSITSAAREGREVTGAVSQEPAIIATYESLMGRVRALPLDDLRAARGFLAEALDADLQAGELEHLVQTMKDFSGLKLGVLRPMVKELSDAKAQRRLEGAKEEMPEVYVRDQGKLYNQDSGKLITREAFGLTLARTYGGSADAAIAACLTNPDALCEVAESLTYDPSKPEGVSRDSRGLPVLNTYRGTTLVPCPGSVDLWLGLLNAFQLEGGQPESEGLLDRMAYILQNPGRKFNHGVLLGGEHGIGKDSFIEPLLRAIGRHNVNQIPGGALGSDFNSWQAGAKLVVFNELDIGSRNDKQNISELLKPALAAPPEVLTINEKNVRPYTIPNLIQCFGFSNHRTALHLDKAERRWYAVWANMRINPDPDSQLHKDWAAFFKTYWRWLDEGGAEAVYAWLLARDLSHFDPTDRPIETDWLSEMKTNSMDGVELLLEQQIAEQNGCFALSIVDMDSMVRDLRSITAGTAQAKYITASSIGRRLRAVGVEKIRVNRAYKVAGVTIRKMTTYYALRPGARASDDQISKLEDYRRSTGF